MKKFRSALLAIEYVRNSIQQRVEEITRDKSYINTENVRKEIKSQISNMMARNVVKSSEITRLDLLWNCMTLKEKWKWFVYNRIFKSWGQQVRDQINLMNEDNWDNEDYVWLKYPNYAEPQPKLVMQLDLNIRPVEGIDFVTCTINTKGE